MMNSEIKSIILEEVNRSPERSEVEHLARVINDHKLSGIPVIDTWSRLLETKRIKRIWVDVGSASRPRWIQRWITT